ncbi:high-affinity cGMP-specific 3',5'-cyclic phosphodiesterase 9A [Thecamonas trahens ATCC 50062]|uniref:Phosphodiesterase n=1 Tax=Thecamonas trahens ATCC 50062 TaxID=461836 RepID=A0A0L0DC86_THETB|nr:high-affinity cGMP-specific 3',5'-cyclic phosphodiesterase 9A [Thecamonas trahens ATCC 50062]KNC49696.1 high-affinity cGMP-specific 3',5'-cyclic phosphodiesterase 9A [Thecamonas trahens ATCC 50062]|eukprot:XP_013757491.1 high-affinity cGMP-specific 3',5'-cyclic phosphodiesterase 9A [Thecamonas trahens ATCC 50062]
MSHKGLEESDDGRDAGLETDDGGLERHHSTSQSRLLLYNPDEPLLPHDVHVLFVEDEPVSRRLAIRVLANEGYKVTEATDGAEAWELLTSSPEEYTIVVSDVTMPRVDGTTLLARIRTDGRFDELPMVMMSSTDETEVCYRCLTNGADDFIIKPIRARKVANLWQVVWKKRKESVTSRELAEERRKRREMASTISSLHSRISSAIETPLAHVMASLDVVLSRAQVDPHVVSGIRDALAALGAKSLYQEAFEETVRSSDMDTNTKAWLLGQVRNANLSSTPVKLDAETHKPCMLNSSGGDLSSECSDLLESTEETILDELASLETFEMLTLTEDDMARYLEVMFTSLNGPNVLHIDVETFQAFVTVIRDHYRDNAYHNFKHAFDVTQFVHWLLVKICAVELLSPLDVIATFLAALCHDVDHPGLNNNFQINTVSPLALRYNDMSVLENHHAAVAFSLMLGSTEAAGSGAVPLLSGLSRAEFKSMRKKIVTCILGTDLAQHVEIMRRWEEVAVGYDADVAAHRELLAVMLVKCADISNPLRPFALSKFWSDMIIDEGIKQGAAEAALGLPISPGMDPETVNQPQFSIGFIDYFVMPSFRALERVLPDIGTLAIPLLSKNRYRWQTLLDVAEAVREALARERELMAEAAAKSDASSSSLSSSAASSPAASTTVHLPPSTA